MWLGEGNRNAGDEHYWYPLVVHLLVSGWCSTTCCRLAQAHHRQQRGEQPLRHSSRRSRGARAPLLLLTRCTSLGTPAVQTSVHRPYTVHLPYRPPYTDRTHLLYTCRGPPTADLPYTVWCTVGTSQSVQFGVNWSIRTEPWVIRP